MQARRRLFQSWKTRRYSSLLVICICSSIHSFIFGGYSRQQLQYMIYQMNTGDSYRELLQKYSKLNKYGKLMIDCNAQEVSPT